MRWTDIGSLLLAALIVLVLVHTLWPRDRMTASPAAVAVHGAAAQLYAAGGDPSFAAFRTAVPDADAVLYADVRDLYQTGRLTPSEVEKVL
jgi:hypothetical protein